MSEEDRRPHQEVLIQDGPNLTRAVRSLEVEDNDRLADKATIIIDDSLGLSAEAIRLGQRISVEMGWDSDHATMFEGVIVDTENAAAGDSRQMTIVAHDLSTLMHRQPCADRYTTGKLSDLLKELVGQTEVAIPEGVVEPDPDPEFTEDAALVRPMVTDLQFIQLLALEHRARAFVEYNEGCSRFYFVPMQRLVGEPAVGILRCCSGWRELTEFRFERVSTNAAPFAPASVMNAADASIVTTTEPEEAEEEEPTVDPEREQAADAAGQGDTYRQGVEAAAAAEPAPSAMQRSLSSAGLPSDPVLAELMTRPDPTTVMGLRGRGTAIGNIHIRAKTMVTIDGIASYAAGDWYVRVARHTVRNGTYQTGILVTR